MMRIDRAEPAHRRRDRNLQTLGEREQLGRRAAVADRLPDEHDGALGIQQHVDRLHDTFRVGAAARRNIGAPFLRVRRFLGRRFHEHVERHIEHDGPRPARHHRFPRLPDRERHHLAARRLIDAFADAAHGRWEIGLALAVHLLEGAAIELAGRHVAGDGEKRHRVEIGRRERDRQVGRARPARGECRDRLARDAVIDVGHEAADALMMGRDRLDIGRALIQRVDELDVAVAAQAKRVGHLLLDQIVDDHLCAVELVRPRHEISSPAPSSG